MRHVRRAPGSARSGAMGREQCSNHPALRFSPMHHFIAAAAQTDAIDWWPLGVLAIALAFVVVMITKFRLYAFIALIAAAMLTGLLADTKLLGEFGTLPKTPAKEKSHYVRAV